jgi:hypothetical protein
MSDATGFLPIKRVRPDTVVLMHWIERHGTSRAGAPAAPTLEACRTTLPAIVCDCRRFLIERED